MVGGNKTKIMVFGTFDLLHKGHLSFFKQARSLAKNPFLIVSVARDTNVKKIKGYKPIQSQQRRLKAVKKCGLVNKTVLGGAKAYLPHIRKESPEIIALGYDQTAYVDNLKRDLLKGALLVKIRRLRAFKPATYKTTLVKKQFLK